MALKLGQTVIVRTNPDLGIQDQVGFVTNVVDATHADVAILTPPKVMEGKNLEVLQNAQQADARLAQRRGYLCFETPA